MKRIIFFMFCTCMLGVLSLSAKDKDNVGLSYELKCGGTPKQGFYLVEVTAYADSKKDANLDLVKKCAVHGVLFKGFSGDQGCTSQRALLSPTKEQEFADFFNSFFQNEYLSYASAVDPAVTLSKVGKKYAVTAVIMVSKNSLRESLENAGVIRKLGF